MPSRHWLYFGAFVLTGIALGGVVLMGLIDAMSVLSAGVAYGEEFILLAMLGEAAEWFVITLVLFLLALLFLTATIVSVLRNTSLHRSDRLVSIVERLEHEYPVLRQFDVSKKVEPTSEDRRAELKERYVAGEITEEEFERKMEGLMDEDSGSSRTRPWQ